MNTLRILPLLIILNLILYPAEAATHLSWNLKAGYHAIPQPYDHLTKILRQLPPAPSTTLTAPKDLIVNSLRISSLRSFLAKTASAEIFLEEEKSGFLVRSIVVQDPLVGDFLCKLLIPNHVPGERFPSLLALHGHGGNADSFARRELVEEIVRLGVVVAIPHFRAMRNQYEANIGRKLLNLGFPLMGIRIYECLRVLEITRSLSMVQPEKIAVMGHSGGSTIAQLLSYVEDDFRACVSDHDSSFHRSHDEICCEGIPPLSHLANQIHRPSSFPCPILKTPYNYLPQEDHVLKFLSSHLEPPGESKAFKELFESTLQALKDTLALSVKSLLNTTDSTHSEVESSLEHLIALAQELPSIALRDGILKSAADLGFFLGSDIPSRKALQAMKHPRRILETRLRLLNRLHQSSPGRKVEFSEILKLCESFKSPLDRGLLLSKTAAVLAQHSQKDLTLRVLNLIRRGGYHTEQTIQSLGLALEALYYGGRISEFLSFLDVLKQPEDRLALILELAEREPSQELSSKLFKIAHTLLNRHFEDSNQTLFKILQIRILLLSKSNLSGEEKVRVGNLLGSIPSNRLDQTRDLAVLVLNLGELKWFLNLLVKIIPLESRLELLTELFTDNQKTSAHTALILKTLKSHLLKVNPPLDRLSFIREILEEAGDGKDLPLLREWFQLALDSIRGIDESFDRYQDELLGLLKVAAKFGEMDLIFETMKLFPPSYPSETIVSEVLEASLKAGYALHGLEFGRKLSSDLLSPGVSKLLHSFQKSYGPELVEFNTDRSRFLNRLCLKPEPDDVPEFFDPPVIRPIRASERCLGILLAATPSEENLERLLTLLMSKGLLEPGSTNILADAILPRIFDLKEESEVKDRFLLKAVRTFMEVKLSKEAMKAAQHIVQEDLQLQASLELSVELSFEDRIAELNRITELSKSFDNPGDRAELLLQILSASPRNIPLVLADDILEAIRQIQGSLEVQQRFTLSHQLVDFFMDREWKSEALQSIQTMHRQLRSDGLPQQTLLPRLKHCLVWNHFGQKTKSTSCFSEVLRAILRSFPSPNALLALRDLAEEEQDEDIPLPPGLSKVTGRYLAQTISEKDPQFEEFCEVLEEIRTDERLDALEPLHELCD